MEPRAVAAVAGALLASCSAHIAAVLNAALRAERCFTQGARFSTQLSLSSGLRFLGLRQRLATPVVLLFSLVFTAVLGAQPELQTLTALVVQVHENQYKDACRRIYMWAFASRRLFACLVVVRVFTRLGSRGFVARNLGHSAAIFPA